MKCALITEEQIKAIEDALERAYDLRLTVPIAEQAIAIVKSLKVSEPIAWMEKDEDCTDYISWEKYADHLIPLYALGDEK